MSKITVICHFRNEENYLQFWLKHHVKHFDHGIMIDYKSSDRSVEIIRALAPTWEIRPTRNELFSSEAIDQEVMDIEKEITEWKMCLNVTEFLIHPDLHSYIDHELMAFDRFSNGVVTTGFIMHDTPELVDEKVNFNEPLWVRRHFGYKEPDPEHIDHCDRNRLIHRASHGNYGPGRHNNSVSAGQNPILYLFWYGWCPLPWKWQRNQSTIPMLNHKDLQKGWGTHHTLDEKSVRQEWMRKQQFVYDIFERYPDIKELVK